MTRAIAFSCTASRPFLRTPSCLLNALKRYASLKVQMDDLSRIQCRTENVRKFRS